MTPDFLLEIIAAPAHICLGTLASPRWGNIVGGWLAGLPLTSAPVSVFFVIDHGPYFARRAAEATVGGVVSVVVGLASTPVSMEMAAIRTPRWDLPLRMFVAARDHAENARPRGCAEVRAIE